MKKTKCKKCGRCCFYKIIIDGIPVFTKRCCKYLNLETKKCKVYKRRFDEGIGCLDIKTSIEKRALPSDCPYVENINGYTGPLTPEQAIEHFGNMVKNIIEKGEGMSSNDKVAEWKEKLEKQAKEDGVFLSKHTDNIIKALIRKNGNCPCRVEPVSCPCSYRTKEIEAEGHCHCNLFIKEQNKE